MDERRRNGRFALPQDLTGSFQSDNHTTGHAGGIARFVVKDIGFGGANLISNYLPDIGSQYTLHISGRKSEFSLPVQVIYSNIFNFLTDKEGILDPGILYSIGCRILERNSAQKTLIKYLIQDKTPI